MSSPRKQKSSSQRPKTRVVEGGWEPLQARDRLLPLFKVIMVCINTTYKISTGGVKWYSLSVRALWQLLCLQSTCIFFGKWSHNRGGDGLLPDKIVRS